MKCSTPTVVFVEVVLVILFPSSVMLADQSIIDNKELFAVSVLRVFPNCFWENISQCLKNKILASGKNVKDNINWVNTESSKKRSNTTLSEEALQTHVEGSLVNLGINLLDKYFFRLILPTSNNVRVVTLQEESRKKSLKRRIPLLYALKLKALALILVYLYFLSTLAMMIGKLVLSISGIIMASQLMTPEKIGL